MERYDSIEYSFDTAPACKDTITVTDNDGFITSQQYMPDDSANDTFSDSESIPEPEVKRPTVSPKEAVLVFQLVVCIVLAVAAFAIKSIGGELYENIKCFYYDNLNNSIIIDMLSDNDSFVSSAANAEKQN